MIANKKTTLFVVGIVMLAVLSGCAAQDNLPVSAIFYMRHYLLLKPDAKDARSAQGKIYKLELIVQENQK